MLALKDFCSFAARRGALASAILSAVQYLKQPKLLPRHTLSHQEVMRVLQAVPADTPIHIRDRAILEVLYSSAVRREELAKLRLEHLDLDGGLLRIEGGKGNKDRVAPLGRHAIEWLGRYVNSARPALLHRREDPGCVFLSKRGLALDGSSVREAVRRWARAAGIDKPVGPHTLRRSCATEMIRAGASAGHVKEILGHEDFASLSSYVKLAAADLKEALLRFHPRERGCYKE
jgi:integrase/recombinase XerD